jgi:hypothetical protein
LFVDPEVQGAVVVRCLIYWCLTLFVVFVALLSPEYIFAILGLVSPTSPSIWLRYAPGLVIASAMTALMALDLLRCTNRFAGPMVRTRRFLRSLANGESVEPISFRRGDYWRGYADELNAVLRHVQSLEEKISVKAEAEDASSQWDGISVEGKDTDLVHSH